MAQHTQLDSIQQLKQIEVLERRHLLGEKAGKLMIDSAWRGYSASQRLSDVLQNQTPIFIKSYGPGSLSSISLRGGSASQTAIVWNGFNLQNPMLGQIDMSLVPIYFVDEATVQPVANSARWGSGAISGIVQLNNQTSFNKGISLGYSSVVGSFQSFFNGLRVHYSNKNISSTTRLLYNKSENNFPFQNLARVNKPLEVQTNSAFREFGLLHENAFRFGSKNIFSVKWWYQESEHNIPPTMLQLVSKAKQEDKALRVCVDWEYKSDRVKSYVRSAFFDETIFYSDSISHIFSNSNSLNFINEVGYAYLATKSISFNSLINYTHLKAVGDGYFKQHEQNRMAIAFGATYKNKNEKISSTIQARQEFVDGVVVQPAISGGFVWHIAREIGIELNISKNYRLPTFNDLYWFPGGNVDLKPEESMNQSVSLFSGYTRVNTTVNATLGLFNRNTINWIIWLPKGNVWTPQNIMNVWSRGFEGKLECSQHVKKIELKVSALYNYVLSTNQKAKTANDESLDKQLIYTPVHKTTESLQIIYKNTSCSALYQFSGISYTTANNTDWLDGFSTTDIVLSHLFTAKKISTSFFLRANNVFDQQYQIVAWRPMPGRNYQVGLTINLNNK